MIQVESLRVGNWVKYGTNRMWKPGIIGTATKIAAAHFEDIQIFGESLFDPIPLTEEILGKCGFVKIKGKQDIYRLRAFQLYMGIEGKALAYTMYDATQYCHLRSIETLHDLQNLFFALYAEELEIEL